MPNYIVNKNAQSNGDNEVHVTPQQPECKNYPIKENQEELGYYASCRGAVDEAKRRKYKANGCRWCAELCHTS